MKITYIEKYGHKLFSFYRHDFKSFKTGEFIDGGLDYTRSNTTVKSDTIENLIVDIRKQFKWTATYNKDGTLRSNPVTKLLQDLDTDHIIAILKYFTEKVPVLPVDQPSYWKMYHLIFLEELNYRLTNGLMYERIFN